MHILTKIFIVLTSLLSVALVPLVMLNTANEETFKKRWLDEQIRFDADWEQRVIDRILHNLSLLFDRSIDTAQELNRYRRELAQRLGVGALPLPEQSQAA